MGALARFSDSLEEMEPSCPHQRGHRDASTATVRPFPWLGGCAPPAHPPGFAGKEQFSSQEGAPPCLAHLSMDMCLCESSALQKTSPPHPIPIPVLGMSWCLPVLILLAPHLPRPSLQAQMLFGGEEASFSPRTPVTFLVGPMGKNQWGRVVPAVAAHCLDICIPSPCRSSPGHGPQWKIYLRPSLYSLPGGAAPFLPSFLGRF